MSRTQDRLADALEAAAGAVRPETLRPPDSARARRQPSVLAPVAAAVSVVVIIALALAVTPLLHSGSPATGDGVAPVVPVGGFPTGIALDSAHHTIYVSAGAADELSMINSSACNATQRAGCGHAQRVATGGRDPIGVAVDEQTSTVYVANGESNSVAVINAAACNASDTSGCTSKPVLVNVPGGPEFLAIDPQTDTIYVADTGAGTVSVIDGSTCNAADTSGCSRAPATVSVGAGAFPIAVDPATNTVYVGVTGGVAVIDGQACNASHTSGCATRPAMVAVANQPAGISVDQATGTVYVSGEGGSVAVIGRGTCDAADTAGCANAPAMVGVGSDPRGDAVDPATGTVYVTNAASDTVSMLNAATCNAADQASCRAAQSAFPVGASPRRIAVDPATHTVYVVNVGASTLSVINSLTCNAADTHGCPTKSPAGTGRAVLGRAAPAGMASTCAPADTAAASGEPAGAFTRSSTQIASGSVAGQPWTLWAKRGVTGVNAVEDGGVVLGGRWYGLCAGYPNQGEMELIDAGPHGIAYGFVAFPGQIGVKLTSGGALPAPQVRRVAAGISFFIGELPGSACTYSTMVLNATGRSVSSMHHLGFGTCQAGRLVAITESNGEWGGRGRLRVALRRLGRRGRAQYGGCLPPAGHQRRLGPAGELADRFRGPGRVRGGRRPVLEPVVAEGRRRRRRDRERRAGLRWPLVRAVSRPAEPGGVRADRRERPRCRLRLRGQPGELRHQADPGAAVRAARPAGAGRDVLHRGAAALGVRVLVDGARRHDVVRHRRPSPRLRHLPGRPARRDPGERRVLVAGRLHTRQPGPHRRGGPVQPRRVSTAPISRAVSHGRSVTSAQAYRSVTTPCAAAALSR
jgi:DNA-binding beta-propeller fold protein YncE